MSEFTTINGAFSKGFVGGYNEIATPPTYSNYLRNCRLENNGICMRDGYRVYTRFGELGEIIKLKATERSLYALVITSTSGRALHLYKLLPSGYRDIGIVSTRVTNNYSNYDLVAIGECLLILCRGSRPYRYREGDGLVPLADVNMPSIDGGYTPNLGFQSDTGVYYSGFVFLNEIVDYKPTNRVILSHEVNKDTKDWYKNARDFSARRDADNLLIPYKIICPSAVQTMISTQQNLYIFCQDSVQYLDKSLLSEYATNKTLRTLPLASGNRLMGKNLCCAAGNFVFFMCKDKHIRTLGYTSGIYDPQIADITDTQFGIQKWINDHVGDSQDYAFAFFNKQDYTVEFHLQSEEIVGKNDIVLIRDLQHQQWLIDNGKHFASMENYDRDRTASNADTFSERSGTAHVVAGGGGVRGEKTFFYQCESKYDTFLEDGEVVIKPIEFEYNTTNIAMGENAELKLFNGIRLTGAINIHTGNTDEVIDGNTGLFAINVFVDGKQICNKKVNRQQLYDTYQKEQIEVGGKHLPAYDPEKRNIVVQYNNYLFPVDIVLDQALVRRKGKRIRVQIVSKTTGADLYLSGLSIRATPLGHFDLSDKF